jgi:hypothetical protein
LPEGKELISSVVALLFHKYEYAPVPPLTVMFNDPELFPLQATLVKPTAICIADGCIIVAVVVVAHPFASVTVTL